MTNSGSRTSSWLIVEVSVLSFLLCVSGVERLLEQARDDVELDALRQRRTASLEEVWQLD